jgi:hypothetical protein
VYDQICPVEEAIAAMPQYKDLIMAARSQQVQIPGSNYTKAAIYDQTFHRDMVVIRTVWLAGQPVPMTEAEALEAGLIKQGQIGTGNFPSAPMTDEAGAPLTDQAGAPVTTQGEEEMRPALVAADGLESKPGAPNWPMTFGVREIRIVEGSNGAKVLFDGRCPYDKIPLVVNVNIPIPYSPYGQGEPKRLEGQQAAFNRLISAIVTHFEYNAYPPEITFESLNEMLDQSLRTMRTQPNKRVVVPDDIAQMVGYDMNKLVTTLDVPQMGSDAWRLLEFLSASIDKESNNNDVMQGNAPAGSSGEWVKSLQQAAQQAILSKSMFTESWLREIALLFLKVIMDVLTADDWAQRCGKYPPQVIASLHQRRKKPVIDISVQINSGSNSLRQQQTSQLVALRQIGVPVSDDTLFERHNLDGEAERKKNARAAMETMPAPQQQNPEGEEGGESGSNGNGNASKQVTGGRS